MGPRYFEVFFFPEVGGKGLMLIHVAKKGDITKNVHWPPLEVQALRWRPDSGDKANMTMSLSPWRTRVWKVTDDFQAKNTPSKGQKGSTGTLT